MSKPKPPYKWVPSKPAPLSPEQRPVMLNSVTYAKPLQAISIPDNCVVGESWRGPALTSFMVDPSMWGGVHYRIKLYQQGTTIPRFMVRMDCEKHSEEGMAQARELGETFLLLLNAIRTDPSV